MSFWTERSAVKDLLAAYSEGPQLAAKADDVSEHNGGKFAGLGGYYFARVCTHGNNYSVSASWLSIITNTLFFFLTKRTWGR